MGSRHQTRRATIARRGRHVLTGRRHQGRLRSRPRHPRHSPGTCSTTNATTKTSARTSSTAATTQKPEGATGSASSNLSATRSPSSRPSDRAPAILRAPPGASPCPAGPVRLDADRRGRRAIMTLPLSLDPSRGRCAWWPVRTLRAGPDDQHVYVLDPSSAAPGGGRQRVERPRRTIATKEASRRESPELVICAPAGNRTPTR